MRTFLRLAQTFMKLHHSSVRRLVHTYEKGSTIFSLSSGHGKCGVAVIRASGPGTADIVKQLGSLKDLPPPRKALLRTLVDPDNMEKIDKALVIWFPGPHSFTGEDCAEFHVHGGPAVISATLSTLGRLPHCRQAEPGEFTKRAFMNGKLDLTEVEGLGDLIHAETEQQRKQAFRQMEGDLSKMYNDWRNRLIKCTANVEAFIDFGEDENIEEDVLDTVNLGVSTLQKEISAHLKDNRRGERLRDGVHVAIVGEPNVGKSSLLNAICQRPAAIVSPIAGTTRDVVETALNLAGYPIMLSDTAGLRETSDIIEKEGVRRALNRAQGADLKILVTDSQPFINKLTSRDRRNFKFIDFVSEHFRSLGILQDNVNMNVEYSMTELSGDSNVNPAETLVVFNKYDLLSIEEQTKFRELFDGDSKTAGRVEGGITVCCMSCNTGQGMIEFLDLLKEKVQVMCGNPLLGSPSLTQERHRSHLEQCLRHLISYKEHIGIDDPVLAAQMLRKSLREIGKISGKISAEDILDVVFRDFCIGK